MILDAWLHLGPREILQAANLASENIFTSFYLKDVSWGEENCNRFSILKTVKYTKKERLG